MSKDDPEKTALKLGRLTAREREVLDCLDRGEGLAAIHRRLNLSRARVAQIASKIDQKLAAIEAAERNAAAGVGLQTPLDLLPLSTRTRNGLQRAGCRTLDDAAQLSDQEVLEIKNLGLTSLRELRAVERKLGNQRR